MAGIGRSSSKAEKTESIEELERDFNATTNKIRALLGGRKDRNDLPDEDRLKLRTEYSRAAHIAKTLSDRVTQEEQAKKYKKFLDRKSVV